MNSNVSQENRCEMNESTVLRQFNHAVIMSFFSNTKQPRIKITLLLTIFFLFIVVFIIGFVNVNQNEISLSESNYKDVEGLQIVDNKLNSDYIYNCSLKVPYQIYDDADHQSKIINGANLTLKTQQVKVNVNNCGYHVGNSFILNGSLGQICSCENCEEIKLLKDNESITLKVLNFSSIRCTKIIYPSSTRTQIINVIDFVETLFTNPFYSGVTYIRREVVNGGVLISSISCPQRFPIVVGNQTSDYSVQSLKTLKDVSLWLDNTMTGSQYCIDNPPRIKKINISTKSLFSKVNEAMGVPLLIFSLLGLFNLIFNILSIQIEK